MEKSSNDLHGFVLPPGANKGYVVGAGICDAEVYDISLFKANAFEKQMVIYEVDSLVLERAEDIHGSYYYVIRDHVTDPSNKFKLNEVIRGYNDYARWISQQGMGTVKLGPTRKLNIVIIDTTRRAKSVVDTTISYQISSGMEGASTTLPKEIVKEEVSKYIDPSVRDRLLLTSTGGGYRSSPYRRFVDYFPTYTLFQGLCNDDPELVVLSLYKGGNIKLLLQMQVVIKSNNPLICTIIHNYHRLSGISICGVDSLLSKWLSSNDLKTPPYDVPDHFNYPSIKIDSRDKFTDYISLNKPHLDGSVAIWKTTSNIRLIRMVYPMRIVFNYLKDLVTTFKDDISVVVYKAFTEFVIPYYEGKDINWAVVDKSKLDNYEADTFTFNIDTDLVSALLWISIVLGDPILLSKLELDEDTFSGIISRVSNSYIGYEDENNTIHPMHGDDEDIFLTFRREIELITTTFDGKNILTAGSQLAYDDILSYMTILSFLDDYYLRQYPYAILKNLTAIEKMEKVREAIDNFTHEYRNMMLTIPLIVKNIPLERDGQLPYGLPLSITENGDWY